jgi:hypothetical protein
MQVTAKLQIDETLQMEYPSVQEAEKALKALGLPTKNIYDMGKHEYEPIAADDDDEAAHAQHRRKRQT